MEKEFARYKAQSKEEIDRNEKTMEEMEGKISEVGALKWKQVMWPVKNLSLETNPLGLRINVAIWGIHQNFPQGRRNAESWKRKHDSVQVRVLIEGTCESIWHVTHLQTDLESTIKEKYNLEAQIEQLKDDIGSLKETHADEVKA